MQRDGEIEARLDDGDEHIDRGSDPEWAFGCVFGSAEEALNAKMLLEALKEQLDSPAGLVERADHQVRELELVGQKHQGLGCFGVLESDATQVLWMVLAGIETIERNCVVADQAGTAVGRRRVQTPRAHIRIVRATKKALI